MKKTCILFIMISALHTNPIVIEVINEFQVAPYDSERVELRYLQSSALDTVFTEIFDLYNTEVVTPVGVAYVDTDLCISGVGQTVIDRSVLTGIFELLDDTGFVGVEYPGDSLFYPGHATTAFCAPVPPLNWSAAKFHCFAYDTLYYEYYLISDWYLDSTPTFGAPNDDYPGCQISGYVYENNYQPLCSARVTVTIPQYYPFWHYVFSTPQYPTCCTTYTSTDGMYAFDSLLPTFYCVDVYAEGFQPDTQIVGRLCCTDPITNLDFYLQTGIAENRGGELLTGSFVQPNPFQTIFHITMAEPTRRIYIYDVTGKFVQRINNESMSNELSVDCTDLPQGIYFVALKDQKLKVIKF